jgi:hypothetical protein
MLGVLDGHSTAHLRCRALHQACLCWCLPQVAFDNSVDKHRATPYSRAATEAFDMVYSGGKPDDITVLVAVIS